MNFFSTYPKKIILKLIRLYQKTLSLDHSWLSMFFPNGYCRFQPTCSEYTYQAIDKYGIIKGGWLGVKRIIRCNPFNKGGHDPIP
jgi:putative membrane protein insertion efficiency factor